MDFFVGVEVLALVNIRFAHNIIVFLTISSCLCLVLTFALRQYPWITYLITLYMLMISLVEVKIRNVENNRYR